MNDASKLWVIVHRKTKRTVHPLNGNENSADQGMLVYRSRQAALAASCRQNRAWAIDSIPMRLSEADLTLEVDCYE